MSYDQFIKEINEAASRFKNVDKKEPIRIISHLDADGITSAAIILNAVENTGRAAHLSIVKQLTEDVLKELQDEDYNVFVFTDLGSGQFDLIQKYLPGKTHFILDHHSFDTSIDLPIKTTMINPHLQGIDGSKEISGAGVVYLFAEALDEKNKKTAHLAIIGAIGDVQENNGNGFSEINTKILDTAISSGKLKVEKGLKWFGLETRPLVRLLNYGNELVVPEVTGSETQAVQFLTSIGIEPKKGNDWKTFNDLTEDEQKKFISAIIMKRKDEKNPEDVFGKRYILADEVPSSPFRDAKEFSTLLNACGRLDKATHGIGACLNDLKSKAMALKILEEYRNEIISSMRWYDNNKESENIIIKDNYILINAKGEVRPTIIGTLASIISNKSELKDNTIILSMAYDDKNIKVSTRIKGDYDIDLRDVIKEILENVDGEGGGHKCAAGAVLHKVDELKFFKEAEKVLDKINLN